MPVNISCPACANQGELPDNMPAGATLTCRACGVRFPAELPAPPILPAVTTDSHEMGVWLGDGTVGPPITALPAAPTVTPKNAAAHLEWVQSEMERFELYVNRQLGVLTKMREQIVAFENKTRTEAVQREQANARDRALLEARSRELDAQEAKISAALKLQAEELQAELDRQVAAERENLARRAEALARTERSLERRMFELDELERGVRQELEEAAGRLTATPVPRGLLNPLACG